MSADLTTALRGFERPAEGAQAGLDYLRLHRSAASSNLLVDFALTLPFVMLIAALGFWLKWMRMENQELRVQFVGLQKAALFQADFVSY